MHFLLKINTRRNKRLSPLILAGFLTLFLASAASVFLFKIVFAEPTEPVPSVSFTSTRTDYTNSQSGSWSVNKMAGWTGKNKARVIIDVDTKLHYQDKKTDILLVVDRSNNNNDNNRANIYRQALKSFANRILDADNDRRVALVSFDYDYQIMTDFTNDRNQLTSSIDNIIFGNNGNNYYQALNGAEVVLRNYQKEADRDVIMLFVTDDGPGEEHYFQTAEYRLIKLLYPFITINAVQYDMGEVIMEGIASISDNQFTADVSNFEDVLFDATVIPYYYSEFVLTDYIDERYFTLSSSEAQVEVNKGTYSIESDGDTPKIVWDLSEVLRSGASATMEISLDLRPEYATEPILFPTNRRTNVISSIPELDDENVTISSSPVLKANYMIRYVNNTPSDCELTGAPADRTQFTYDVVEMVHTTPVCTGYKFAGYKTEARLKKINDDYFIMPPDDITFVATWAKVGISKTVDGTVHVVKYLYDEIDKKAQTEGGAYNLDSSIDFTYYDSFQHAHGVYTLTSTAEDEYPVHYFRGEVDDNNVLFAGMCWYVVRTTSTGGVKLIYNGEPDSNNQCGASRSAHEGYGRITSSNFSSYSYFGTDYTYDAISNTFSLAGNKTLGRMTNANGDELLGQYTCKSTNQNASCSTLYFVVARNGTSSAYVLPINTSIPYYAIGKLPYNYVDDSPAYSGYMYGDTYDSTRFYYTGDKYASAKIVISNSTISNNFWYADDIVYDPDNSGHYYLVNPYQMPANMNNNDVIGKYTFRNSSSDYSDSSVYYIAAVNGNNMYYLHLKDGDTLENVDVKYNVSETIIDHGDGTYTMVDPVVVKTSEWYAMHNDFNDKFVCEYSSTNTCSNIMYVTVSGNSLFRYVNDDEIVVAKSRNGYNLQDTTTIKRFQISQNPSAYTEYKYSCQSTDTVCTPENFIYIYEYNHEGYKYFENILLSENAVWNGEQYVLTGQAPIEDINNFNSISTHHFFCENPGQTTCDSVRYLNTASSNDQVHYFYAATLTNGITPAQAVENMFKNEKDSLAKSVVEAWYARNLVDYTDKIEDTPYCNERNLRNLGGWDPNGGDSSDLAHFEPYYRGYSGGNYEAIMECSNTRDAFTVSDEIGNGKLTYPVGLLTVDEVNLTGHGRSGTIGNKYLRVDSNTAMTMTPVYYSPGGTYIFGFGDGFSIGNAEGNYMVRPVISVVPGTIISTGDGTAENPWVLE